MSEVVHQVSCPSNDFLPPVAIKVIQLASVQNNKINTFKENMELSIKVNKAMNELDDIASDINLQAYTRTQIWNIVSSLEKI